MTKAFDPVCYAVNSISMGDIIVSAAVIKWAIKNLHPDGEYTVLVYPRFKDILHFVPETNYKPFGHPWKFQKPYLIRYLNTIRGDGGARTTSLRMPLWQFASIQLTDRVIPKEELSYVSLPEVPVDQFGVDFSNAVLISCTHVTDVRTWSYETVHGIAEWVRDRGMVPVYIGKVDNDPILKDSPFRASFKDVPSFGVDLRNKTSMTEIASIMNRSKAIVGIDGGLIHLAGTTSIPIVCGYTTCEPTNLHPLRTPLNVWNVVPDSECRHCQSRTNLNYHDYGFCYLGHANCVKEMTADKFIRGLESALGMK